MNRLFSCFAFLSAFAAGSALVACGPTVTCEGAGCGSTEGAGGTMEGGGARSAILYGSDDLTVRLTSFPVPCTDPEQDAPVGLCGFYSIKVTFPPSLLQEGPVDTSSGLVELFRSLPVESGTSPGGCGTARHEGGFSGSEKLTFVSVEEPFVIVKIEELDPELIDGHDLNGLHMVKRCP